jgi:hypothetical protein
MHHRSITDSELKARAAALGSSSDHRRLDLTLWALFGRADGCLGPSVSTPIWRVVRLHGVGALIRGHDVSGTAKQTLGRAMQSTTTMMPVWQCGHSRSDCPVSAWKRSR